jgi:hypothetical protein
VKNDNRGCEGHSCESCGQDLVMAKSTNHNVRGTGCRRIAVKWCFWQHGGIVAQYVMSVGGNEGGM